MQKIDQSLKEKHVKFLDFHQKSENINNKRSNEVVKRADDSEKILNKKSCETNGYEKVDDTTGHYDENMELPRIDGINDEEMEGKC